MPAARPALQAAALSVLLFLVYALGASRTIYVGDSGELVTAVHLLGIPHPSGYPLYVLLGKLWTLLVPFGSVAFRMSLFSAACAALAGGTLFLLCRAMGLSATAAGVAASLLAFSPSFWSQATIQRVYTLSALLLLLVALAAWCWERRREPRWLILAFVLAGLGASNHLFLALAGASLAVFAVCREPSLLRRPWVLLGSAAGFAIGLLPYAYLPLRSRADPRLDWGNPESWDGFLGVILRRDFWDRAWLEGPADLLPILLDYLLSVGAEMAWVGAGLAMLAVVVWRHRRDRFLLFPLLIMAANVGALALHGSRTDLFVWHRYYIPSYAMAALLAGVGCQWLLQRMPGRAVPIWLLLPLALVAMGWSDQDRSRYRIVEDFSRSLLDSLPPGAHLIATDDNILFSLMYLHLVEGERPDVDLILQGVGGARLPPLRFKPELDPLYLTHHPNWSQPGLAIVPMGLAFRAARAGREPVPLLVKRELDGEDDPRVPKDYLTRNVIGHFHYMRGVTLEQRDWVEARHEFLHAARSAPDNDVLFYNLGLIYRRNGLLEDALRSFRRSDAINHRHLASRERPRASEKIEQVEQEIHRLDRVRAALTPEVARQGAAPGSVEEHLAWAATLERVGEPGAARGHRRRAAELEADPE